MGAHSWPEEYMVFGPFPWEETLVEEHSVKAQEMPDDIEERREISSALARLYRCLGDLLETFDSLAERLEPVLPDDDCECGHERASHFGPGPGQHDWGACVILECPCQAFDSALPF